MKFNQLSKAAMLSVILMGTLPVMSQAQNYEARSNDVMKRSSIMPKAELSAAPSVQLEVRELKEIKQMQQRAMAQSLAPKIAQSAERQGVKVSRAEIEDASEKLATLLSNTDVLELDQKLGIKIKIFCKIKKPLECGIEISFSK